MTILPKKKHSESKKPDSSSNNDGRGRIRGAQNRPSPPERSSLNRSSEDYVGESFESREAADAACSTKRRHRGSPHRHKYHERHSDEAGYNSSDEHDGQNMEVVTEEVCNDLADIWLCFGLKKPSKKAYLPSSLFLNTSIQTERQFEQALKEKKGLNIKRMAEDGACLFRAVGKLNTTSLLLCFAFHRVK